MFSRLAAIFLFLPGLAWGFTFLTEGMKGWEKNEIRIYFNPANCSIPEKEIETAIDRAVNAWNSVPTADVKIHYEGRTTQTGTQEDPLIECATSGLDDSIAVTYVSTASGRIFTGYMQLNAEPSSLGNVENYREDRLAIVIAHEMGHILGLGHSVTESALMYFSIGAKEHLALGQDDVDGVTFLYPRKEPEDGLLGCGSLGAPGTGGGGGLLGVLAFLGLFTWGLRFLPTPRPFASPA